MSSSMCRLSRLTSSGHRPTPCRPCRLLSLSTPSLRPPAPPSSWPSQSPPPFGCSVDYASRFFDPIPEPLSVMNKWEGTSPVLRGAPDWTSDLGGGGTSSSFAEIRRFPLEVRSSPGGDRTSGAGGGGAADEGRSAAGAATTAALAACLSA